MNAQYSVDNLLCDEALEKSSDDGQHDKGDNMSKSHDERRLISYSSVIELLPEYVTDIFGA